MIGCFGKLFDRPAAGATNMQLGALGAAASPGPRLLYQGTTVGPSIAPPKTKNERLETRSEAR